MTPGAVGRRFAALFGAALLTASFVGVSAAHADPAATTTTLSAAPTILRYGSKMTFTALVSSPNHPTGLVTFTDGATVIGTATPNLTTRKATLVLTLLSVGPHSIVASFAGDADNAPSTSDPLPVTVYQKTRTDVLFFSQPTKVRPMFWTPSTPIIMVANVITAVPVGATGLPTGTISFGVDGVHYDLPVNRIHGANLLFPNGLSLGKHVVTVIYHGDGTFAPSSIVKAVSINRNLTTTIVDSADPVAPGDTVTYTVTVTNNGRATTSYVGVSNTIPADATFVSATASGGCQGTTTVVCVLPNLAVGASASATIVVRAPDSAETMTDTATALQGLNPTTTETTTVGP